MIFGSHLQDIFLSNVLLKNYPEELLLTKIDYQVKSMEINLCPKVMY